MLIFDVLIIAMRYRKVSAVGVLAFLPFLGLIRRILIPISGWPALDPLLIIAPITALTVLALNWYERIIQPKRSWFAYWLTIFVAWMILESVNPNGGILGNIAGAMYIVVPILWFYIGRVYGSPQLLRGILIYVFVAAVVVAIYGLYQTFIGFPSWDASWIRLGGYAALHVGGVVRAFGTFPSSSEYGEFLVIGLLIGFALLVRRHQPFYLPIVVAIMAIIGSALILESQRSAILYAVIGSGLIWATKMRNGHSSRLKLGIRLLAVILGGVVLYIGFLHNLTVGDGAGPSGLVEHETTFLRNPFGASSTLPGHLTRVAQGVMEGIQHPWGYGLGSVSAGAKLDGNQAGLGSEFDLSNAFVAGGIPGGILFFIVSLLAWAKGFQISMSAKWEHGAVLGIMVALFGNWLNGGQYFVGALLWFTLGIIDRENYLVKIPAVSGSTNSDGIPSANGLLAQKYANASHGEGSRY